ncbi:aldo/keto reductase family protein [Streptomyces phaeoluteigriseus]|uniref:Aldo/keto reductase family protein n=1 Tax=Streptomyces phaeoluteigriseus TaxID=114686 RepID=A0ABY4Z9D7_9ACTN|nr:aldo/keto reductase family protein [Streptomyces phaeoluteigriseus]USQ85659.1 aldo/keto reductase family protein [Streptomyces phaeoluteigriseus]
MEFRQLGRSGLKISAIAYGNWVTHGSQIDEQGARACVHAALDEGITTFDTADAYAATKAEEVLGRALKGQRREGVEILTKVYFPTGPGANDRGLSRKHILESINGSLKRLGCDYVDLYQAHRFDPTTPLEETLRAFDDVVRQGKALYVGVSEWTADQIRAAVKTAAAMGLDRIVSNQPQYSLLQRAIEEEILPLCAEVGIGQIAWSPLAQGVLTGKYLPGSPPPQGSRATDPAGRPRIAHLLRDEVLDTVQKLGPVAREAGLTMSQLALAWVLQNPGVSSAIIGASRPDQIRQNAAAAEVTLDADLMKTVDDLLGGVVNRAVPV